MPITDSLKLVWKLDEIPGNTRLQEVSGGASNLLEVGGDVAASIGIDASAPVYESAESNELKTTEFTMLKCQWQTTLTMTCWVKAKSTETTEGTLVRKGPGGNTSNNVFAFDLSQWFDGFRFTVWTQDNGGVGPASSGPHRVSSGSVVTTGQWHFVRCEIDFKSTSGPGVVNAVRIQVDDNAEQELTHETTTNVLVSLDGSGDGSGDFRVFQQSMSFDETSLDELYIWERLLTETEHDYLYNGGTGYFYPFPDVLSVEAGVLKLNAPLYSPLINRLLPVNPGTLHLTAPAHVMSDTLSISPAVLELTGPAPVFKSVILVSPGIVKIVAPSVTVAEDLGVTPGILKITAPVARAIDMGLVKTVTIDKSTETIDRPSIGTEALTKPTIASDTLITSGKL